MDSSVLYGWKHHNYVFDNNLNRYVLQHRTTTTSDIHPTTSSGAAHHRCVETGSSPADDRNAACIDTPRRERDAIRTTSIDRTDATYVHIRPNSSSDNQRARNKHKKRKWASKYKTKSFKVTSTRPMQEESIQPPAAALTSIPRITSNQYTILTQQNIILILFNWYRVCHPLCYGNRKRTKRLILSALVAYSIERFEFDEHHPLIQTWVNYNVAIDDDASVDSLDVLHSKKPKTNPIEIPKSITSSNDDDELHCPSEDSLSISIDPPLLGLSPTVSFSSTAHSASKHSNKSIHDKPQHNHFECTASLPNVKWATVFFGTILDSALLHKSVYVCNVKVDKLGYGVGFAFFGDNTHALGRSENVFHDENKLKHLIQNQYNGYTDAMHDCFTIYDDGEYCNWNMRNERNKLNVNHLTAYHKNGKRNENNTVKLISKLSKIKLKTTKSKLSLSPTGNALSVPNEAGVANVKPKIIRSKSKKEFYSNPKQKRLNTRKKSRSDACVAQKRNFYGGPKRRKKPKKISEKFCFDEKSDVIQISVDLYRKRISIHNLNNHRCVVIKDFDYELIRIAFVLRYSNVTVMDQKWI